MVLQRRTLERYIPKSSELAKKAGIPANQMRKALKALESDIDSNRRQPAPPCPEGGITVNAGARKHRLYPQTVWRWVQSGSIPVIQKTDTRLFIDAAILADVVKTYRLKPGRGRRTVQKNKTKTHLDK